MVFGLHDSLSPRQGNGTEVGSRACRGCDWEGGPRPLRPGPAVMGLSRWERRGGRDDGDELTVPWEARTVGGASAAIAVRTRRR